MKFSPRYTFDGTLQLEDRIRSDLAAIRKAVLAEIPAGKITALILGGGYGRGEGGVFEEDGREIPFNDYDLFVVVPDTSRKQRNALHAHLTEIGERLGKDMGVDVDFSRPILESNLPRLGPELMWIEMKQGHRVFHGPLDVLAPMPAFLPGDLPGLEGTRLLLNRGVGLLLCRRALVRTGGDPEGADLDFCVRNIRKAEMAMGDVILQVLDRYVVKYRARSSLLEAVEDASIPELKKIQDRYRGAIDFKLRPVLVPLPGLTLEAWLEETVALFEKIQLWFEGHRLGVDDLTWEEYGNMDLRADIRGGLAARMKNVYHNLSAFGPNIRKDMNRLFRHPRESLLKVLPALLHETDQERVTRQLRHRLLAPVGEDMETVFTRRFLPVWSRYN